MACKEAMHVDLVLNKDAWKTEIIKFLSHIKPSWEKDQVTISPMKGSVMNKLYHVTYKSESPLVVRINGTISERYDLDRKQEAHTMRTLSGRGLTPDLVASFNNGLVYEYIAGDKMTKADLAQDGILRKIAYKLAELHITAPSGDNHNVPHVIKLVTMTTKCIPVCPEVRSRIPEELPSEEQVFAELKELTEHLTVQQLPLVLSHNDMWFGNIIINMPTGDIRFIDCEHMGYNYAGFDIAHLFVGITGLQPEEKQLKDFIRDYITRKHEICSEHVTGSTLLDKSVNEMYAECLQCHLINMPYGTTLYLSMYGQEEPTSDSDVMKCTVIEAACRFYKQYKASKMEYLSTGGKT